MRTFAVAFALLVATAAPAAAQSRQHCSREAFPVNGQSVAVTVCAAAPQGQRLAVIEGFTRGSQSFSRSAVIEVLPGAEVSRAIDDASLAPFGMAYTLHLTLAYRSGSVGIEHALLLPGAVPLK